MEKVRSNYIKLADFINRIIGFFIALLLVVMSSLIFWQVFTRFVIGNSISYAEELSRFMMIWLALLGASYAFGRNTLISMDLILTFKNTNLDIIQKIIRVFVQILSMLLAIILLYYGWQLAQSLSNQYAPATGISMFWVTLSIPISSVLIIMNALKHLLNVIVNKG